MVAYYGHFGTDGIQPSDFTVASNNPGSETLWVWVLRLGRASADVLQNPVSVTYDPANPDVQVTLNAQIRASGEQVFDCAIAFSDTNNPQSAIFNGAWRGIEANQITQRSLPATVIFNDPELIKRTAPEIVVPTVGDLDNISPAIHGMVRTVNGQAYRYNGETTEWEVWKSASAYQFQPAKPAEEVNPNATPIPDYFFEQNGYNLDGQPENQESTRTLYWIQNNSGGDFEIGNAINLKNFLGSARATGDKASELIKCTVIGLTNLADGTTDTSTVTTPNAGSTYTWDARLPYLFSLEAPVPQGSALAVEVFYQYFRGQLPEPPNTLKSIPIVQGKYSTYNPGALPGAYTTNPWLWILPTPGGITHTGGVATVNKWNTPILAPDEGVGQANAELLPDTDNQTISIDAQANIIHQRLVGEALFPNEAIRARVSTVGGNSAPSLSATLATTATGTVRITINHPPSINPQYPFIGGLSATGNAPNVAVYLTVMGTITRYDSVNVGTGSQEVIIDGAGGTVVGSIPPGDFTNDLFLAPTPVIEEGTSSGSLPSGQQIDAVIQYQYPTSSNFDVTEIVHGETGYFILFEDVLQAAEGYLGVFPSAAALRAESSQNLNSSNWLRLIEATGGNAGWHWNPNSTATDDGATVIKPDDIDGADPGRYEIDATGGGGVPEAPNDTNTYGRRQLNWKALDKTDVQLDQVDNTSDANKPISTATQAALDTKVESVAPGTTGTIAVDNTDPLNPVVDVVAESIGVTELDPDATLKPAGSIKALGSYPTVSQPNQVIVPACTVLINGVSIASPGGTVTVTGIASREISVIAINDAGTPIFLTYPFTGNVVDVFNNNAFLGYVLHNQVDVELLNNFFSFSALERQWTFANLTQALISNPISGLFLEEVPATLSASHSGFEINSPGICLVEHFSTGINPDIKDIAAQTPITFDVITQTGDFHAANQTVADPTIWDNNGVIQTVPNPTAQSTIAVLYLIANRWFLQPGQEVFADYSTAEAQLEQAIARMVPFLDFGDYMPVAALIYSKGATQWTVGIAKLDNIKVGGGGGSGGGGSQPATTTTTLDFPVPVADDTTTVTVDVVDSSGLNGLTPFGGFYLRVTDAPTSTTLTVTNPGRPDSPTAGSTVVAGTLVGPSNIPGNDGADGVVNSLTSTDGSVSIDSTDPANPDLSTNAIALVQTLNPMTADITLGDGGNSGGNDRRIQHLYPNGATRRVTLQNTGLNEFEIQSIGSGSIELFDGVSVVATLQDVANEVFYVTAERGVEWVIRGYTRA